MPYIKQDFRDEIEDVANLSHLAEYLASTKIEDFVGALNYVITVLARKRLQRTGLNYFELNNLVGSVTCAILELYRKVAGPYENKKIKENGDIDV